jgi:hypothetical protein
MPRSAQRFADEIQEFWDRAEAENRDLTPAEWIHMSELVSEAKSQHDIEKADPRDRRRRPQFRGRYRPELVAYGRRSGRRVRQVAGVPADR